MKELIEIDLSDLYEIAIPDCPASELLAAILEKWGVKYELLVNCSPDAGDRFFDEEFRQHYLRENEEDEEEVVREFAERKKAIPVRLFDGYEWAYAIVFKEGGR